MISVGWLQNSVFLLKAGYDPQAVEKNRASTTPSKVQSSTISIVTASSSFSRSEAFNNKYTTAQKFLSTAAQLRNFQNKSLVLRVQQKVRVTMLPSVFESKNDFPKPHTGSTKITYRYLL